MKKILVSGCANCPYLIVWNDGENNGFESIVRGECRHPSFQIKRDLPPATMDPVVFLDHLYPKGEERIFLNAGRTPGWCPLPTEKEE